MKPFKYPLPIDVTKCIICCCAAAWFLQTICLHKKNGTVNCSLFLLHPFFVPFMIRGSVCFLSTSYEKLHTFWIVQLDLISNRFHREQELECKSCIRKKWMLLGFLRWNASFKRDYTGLMFELTLTLNSKLIPHSPFLTPHSRFSNIRKKCMLDIISNETNKYVE